MLQLDVTRGCLNSIEQDEARQLCKVCPARLVAAPVHGFTWHQTFRVGCPSQAGMLAACDLQAFSLSMNLTARPVPAPSLSVLSSSPTCDSGNTLDEQLAQPVTCRCQRWSLWSMGGLRLPRVQPGWCSACRMPASTAMSFSLHATVQSSGAPCCAGCSAPDVWCPQNAAPGPHDEPLSCSTEQMLHMLCGGRHKAQ